MSVAVRGRTGLRWKAVWQSETKEVNSCEITAKYWWNIEKGRELTVVKDWGKSITKGEEEMTGEGGNVE